jgi:hypothetical protein
VGGRRRAPLEEEGGDEEVEVLAGLEVVVVALVWPEVVVVLDE